MASETRDTDPPQRRRRPAWQLAAGLATTVVVLIVLVVPVVVMLLLSPRGIPTPLPDGLAVVLLAAAGVVVGITVRAARTRPLFALTTAVLVTLLALWFQAGTWWSAAWAPAPPLLPNVPPTLVLVAGVFLATTLAAVLGAGSSHREATPGADRGGAWPARAVLLGAVAAAAIVTVVEGDVWGRRLLQQTFEGPWGLSRFRWLALLFVGLLVAGVLVGWVASTVRHAPLAPTVGAALLAAAVLLVWAVAGLGGPPRSTLYGLTLGLLAVAAVTSLGGDHRTAGRPPDED